MWIILLIYILGFGGISLTLVIFLDGLGTPFVFIGCGIDGGFDVNDGLYLFYIHVVILVVLVS